MSIDKKQQLIELWRTCFDDTEDFLRIFFEQIYQERNAVVLERDGRIVSALHLLTYSMIFHGEEISVAYIYSVCTHPDYRGQGLMAELLEDTVDLLRRRQIPLAVLIPASESLFGLYRRHGFTEAFDYSLEVYHANPTVSPSDSTIYVTAVSDSNPEWYAFFDRCQRTRDLYILHSRDYFRALVADALYSGGRVVGLTNLAGEPQALAFLQSDGSEAMAMDMFCEDTSVRKLFIREIIRRNRLDTLYIKALPRLSRRSPMGMALITQPSRLIRLWADATRPSPEILGEISALSLPALADFLLDYPSRRAFMSLMFE